MELKHYVITLTNGQGYPIASVSNNSIELILKMKSDDVVEITKGLKSKYIFTDQLVEVYETEISEYNVDKSWLLAKEKTK